MRLSIIVPVLVALVVLFSACITGPKPTTTIPTTIIGTTTTIPYAKLDSISKDAISKNDVTTCNQVPDAINRDWCYWTVALANSDVNICNSIQHTTYRPGCYMAVAMMTNNPSICDKIEYGDESPVFATKNRCRAAVGGDLTVCNQITAMAQADTCYLTLGTALKDLSMCEKIRREGTRTLCVDEITYKTG